MKKKNMRRNKTNRPATAAFSNKDVKVPNPAPEEPDETVHFAAEEREMSSTACQDYKDSKPIPKGAADPFKPAVAKECEATSMPTTRGPDNCEYDRPDSR